MDEFQKASILLKHLSPGEREQILGQFDPEQREQMERMIAAEVEVSRDELIDIVSEYQSWLKRLSVTKDSQAVVLDPGETGLQPAVDPDGLRPAFPSDAVRLTTRLSEEPATVLAAVMCQLHEAVAREVYESLSTDRQAAVVARLPAQAELKPVVKQELAACLNDSLDEFERTDTPGQTLLARLVGP